MVPGRAGQRHHGAAGARSRDGDNTGPGGTTIALVFHKPLEPIKAAEIKKMLAPVIDFDKHTVTEIYSETLPPATQKAIQEKRAVEGMNHEQVDHGARPPRLQVARDQGRHRDSKTGSTAHAPGKITFVTFEGDKVIKVKEEYAGLGTQVNDPIKN